MKLNEIVGGLLETDTISGEEAITLLSPKENDIESFEEKISLISELLFGEIITAEEAITIIEGEIPYLDDDDDDDQADIYLVKSERTILINGEVYWYQKGQRSFTKDNFSLS